MIGTRASPWPWTTTAFHTEIHMIMRPLCPRSLRCWTTAVVLFVGATTAHAGGFGVIPVNPARNAAWASTSTSIQLDFNAPVDGATLGPTTVRVYGRWSGPVPGSISVNGSGLSMTFKPARPFFPGEMVSVCLTDAIASLLGETLVGGHVSYFWVGSAAGAPQFNLAQTIPIRMPGEGLVQSYGLFAGDLDGDGSPDFAVPNEVAHDVRVLMNSGCAEFTLPEINALPFGSKPSSNEGQDFNDDGSVDFAVANINGDSMSVMIGVGDGSFAPAVTYPSGNNARGLALLDLEGDGDQDIAIAHRSASTVGLHRNDGSGAFPVFSSFNAGVAGETAVSAADANNDGYVDLLVAGYTSDDVGCLLNDGAGAFTLSDTAPTGLNPWMTAIGDINLDGHIDVVTCNATTDTASVILGDGNGQLSTTATLALDPFSLAIELGDIDGDGDLDIVASSFSGEKWNCFVNDGLGSYGTSFDLPATNAASCATIVDFDRDGFVDIVGVDELDDLLFLYRQDAAHPAGVQQGSCAATLRINNLAPRAGFGGRPPHAVSAGGYLFVGLTAGANEAWFLTAGVAFEPGVSTNFGIYNLAAAPLLLFGGVTNNAGEAMLPVDIPASSPTGVDIALQVFVDKPGPFLLSNPEVVRITP